MENMATARAHPIQGLVKYHGMRDDELRLPYHDSISVCTAPSETVTTVAFDPDLTGDQFVVDGDLLSGHGADRITSVVDAVRERADIDTRVQFVSENSFPTNVGLGSSSSGFAAAAVATAEAAGLDLSRADLSRIARRGSASAARAVAGGFSILYGGMNDWDCYARRLESNFDDELRIIVGLVPAYKETEHAHAEAADSHMFQARLAHIHDQLAAFRDALHRDDFDQAFGVAEHDSLSLAATTMTGPSGWVYWRPDTLCIFAAVRELREEGIPAYFSTDTGATVYINTRATHADTVEQRIADLGVDTEQWCVGGPATVLDRDASLIE